MLKKNILMVTGVFAIITCVALILFSASEFVNPYLSVTDARGSQNQQIQVIGEVVNGSIRTSSNLNFQITDGESTLNVVYSGAPPQNFMEGIDVVVIGRMSSESTFNANQVLTKCPSKYQ